MRNGLLVEEGIPQVIIEKYNAESLEAAFLKLCIEQTQSDVWSLLNIYIYSKIITYFIIIISIIFRLLKKIFK